MARSNSLITQRLPARCSPSCARFCAKLLSQSQSARKALAQAEVISFRQRRAVISLFLRLDRRVRVRVQCEQEMRAQQREKFRELTSVSAHVRARWAAASAVT